MRSTSLFLNFVLVATVSLAASCTKAQPAPVADTQVAVDADAQDDVQVLPVDVSQDSTIVAG